MRALPSAVTDLFGLDPTRLYHLAQIPGMVLLYHALVADAAAPAADRRSGCPLARINRLTGRLSLRGRGGSAFIPGG